MSKEKLIILLGGSVYQYSILQIIKSYNIKVLVIDKNFRAFCKKYADFFYKGDITNINYIMNIYNKYKKKFYILNVISSSEYGIYSSYFINKKNINKKYLSKKQIDFLISKNILSNFIKKYNLNYIQEYKLDKINIDDFPVIIKPTDAMNSLDVYLIHTIQELKVKYNLLKKKYNNQIMIQKYIKGKHFGMKFIYQNSIIDKFFMQRFFNTCFQPIGAIMPIKLKKEILDNIENQINFIFKKKNIKFGIFEVDFIIDENNKVYILEITPQLSAYSGAKLFLLVKSKTLYDVYIRMLLNKKVYKNKVFCSYNKKLLLSFYSLYPNSTKKSKIIINDNFSYIYKEILKTKIEKLTYSSSDQLATVSFFSEGIKDFFKQLSNIKVVND